MENFSNKNDNDSGNSKEKASITQSCDNKVPGKEKTNIGSKTGKMHSFYLQDSFSFDAFL